MGWYLVAVLCGLSVGIVVGVVVTEVTREGARLLKSWRLQ